MPSNEPLANCNSIERIAIETKISENDHAQNKIGKTPGTKESKSYRDSTPYQSLASGEEAVS